jgi:hypothetical protein
MPQCTPTEHNNKGEGRGSKAQKTKQKKRTIESRVRGMAQVVEFL